MYEFVCSKIFKIVVLKFEKDGRFYHPIKIVSIKLCLPFESNYQEYKEKLPKLESLKFAFY